MPNFKEVKKIIEADGWTMHSSKGSHHHFVHPTKKGKVTIAFHGKEDIPKGTMNNILRQAGLK